MTPDLKKELGKVKISIDTLLADDGFPCTVEPELLRGAVREYPMRGGKRIRPALVQWACGAACGKPGLALYASAACEVFHNWTLVHDDIIDRDDMRRGKPSCHASLASGSAKAFGTDSARSALYGTSMAILAGDIQQAWAADFLLRQRALGTPESTVLSLVSGMCMLNRRLVSGEALDVEFEYRPEFPCTDEVKRMIAGKTSALLEFCVMAGASVGGAGEEMRSALISFASNLGYAFQLQDDLLGVFGDAVEFGKPICSDFSEGKPTILFLETLAAADEKTSSRLLSFSGRSDLPADAIRVIRSIIEDTGARVKVEKEAASATFKAMSALKLAGENEYTALLSLLAEKLIGRKK